MGRSPDLGDEIFFNAEQIRWGGLMFDTGQTLDASFFISMAV